MTPETVGVLSPGEMGSSLAVALRDAGIGVVTLLDGRSERTRANARSAGVAVADSPAALVRSADVVLSVVPPAAAIDVARQVAEGAAEAGTAVPFVDLNAIGPASARQIAGTVLPDAPVVDGCLIGPSSDLARVRVYLSGPTAPDHGWLEVAGVETVVLGDAVGQASGVKLLYAGMTKGLSVLGLDLLLAAVALGVEDEVVGLYRDRLGAVADFLDGRLPSDPKRARRRADELAALAEMVEAQGRPAGVFRAGHDRLRWLADLDLDTDDAGSATEAARRIAEAAD